MLRKLVKARAIPAPARAVAAPNKKKSAITVLGNVIVMFDCGVVFWFTVKVAIIRSLVKRSKFPS